MHVLIAGGGIGGLAAALSLHHVGIMSTVFEQVREPRELGVGIDILSHAIKELAALGPLEALDRASIGTRELIYANRFGQVVWRELHGIDAGLDAPQLSIHRGKLHGVLLAAGRERPAPEAVRTGCRLVAVSERPNGVTATFERRHAGTTIDATGDAPIGADGIHSMLRALFYPDEGPRVWNGTMLWRGADEWPTWIDGRTMIIAGGMSAKFVYYPIHADPARPDMRLTNCAVMARVAEGASVPPRREDWNRPGVFSELETLVRERFRLDFVDPLALIRASGEFYEYPLCDRDPPPRWSFGRATLLGDAAHPMYLVGSNGASQAVLDACALARHLAVGGDVPTALTAYEAERRPMTAEIVLNNRKGRPGAGDRRAGSPRAEWFYGRRSSRASRRAPGDRARLCGDGRVREGADQRTAVTRIRGLPAAPCVLCGVWNNETHWRRDMPRTGTAVKAEILTFRIDQSLKREVTRIARTGAGACRSQAPSDVEAEARRQSLLIAAAAQALNNDEAAMVRELDANLEAYARERK
jgi:5-methylphenazine-1-carboxylate 1-monooxygenase